MTPYGGPNASRDEVTRVRTSAIGGEPADIGVIISLDPRRWMSPLSSGLVVISPDAIGPAGYMRFSSVRARRQLKSPAPLIRFDATWWPLLRVRPKLSIHTAPRSCAGEGPAARVVSVSSFMARVPRNLEWTDQVRGTAKASIDFPQRLLLLFSPAANRRHSSPNTKSSLTPSYAGAAGQGCGPIAPRSKNRHRGRDRRGSRANG